MREPTPAQSLALLLHDALWNTEGRLDYVKKIALRDSFKPLIAGRVTLEDEEAALLRLLDADFQVTASFDPEKWREIARPSSGLSEGDSRGE